MIQRYGFSADAAEWFLREQVYNCDAPRIRRKQSDGLFTRTFRFDRRRKRL